MRIRGIFLLIMMLCAQGLRGMERRSSIIFASLGRDERGMRIASLLWGFQFEQALQLLKDFGANFGEKVCMYHDEKRSFCSLLEIALMRLSINPQGETFCRYLCEKMGKDFEKECHDFGILLNELQ